MATVRKALMCSPKQIKLAAWWQQLIHLKDVSAKIKVDYESFFPISRCQLSTEKINVL